MGPTLSPIATLNNATLSDETVPPAQTLRTTSPKSLYAEMPKLASLTVHKPEEEDAFFRYFLRLRESTTPEDAITLACFAPLPRMAIWLGYESVRSISQSMNDYDKSLMQQILKWTEKPYDVLRWKIMQSALYAEYRTPTIFLGLAVGWSGGKVAPNDPLPVPIWRTPQAVNAAVLSALAQSTGEKRQVQIARILDLAAPLMRTFPDGEPQHGAHLD